MFISNFKAFSLGRVVSNKERDSKVIKVYPFEILPHISNEIDDSTRERKKEGIDHVEKKYSVTITEQPWIESEWIGATYMENPPDVAKGELVMLYRSGDSDNYYWDVFGRTDTHRKQEDVVISFSAKADYDSGEPVAKDVSNSYRLRFNTYEKFIELSTSEDNGEVTTYNFKFDMAEGIVTLVDKERNHIYLNTRERIIELLNKDNSKVRIFQKNINIYAEQNVKVESNNVEITAETFKVTANTGILNITNCNVGSGNWNFGASVTFNQSVGFTNNVSFTKPLKVVDHVDVFSN